MSNTFPSSGDAGVGTPNPVNRLHVYCTSPTEGINIGAGLVAAANMTRIWSPNSSPDAGTIAFGDGTGWKFHFAQNSNDGGTKYLTILDTGKVGIGDTSPSDALTVAGAIRTNLDGYSVGLYIRSGGALRNTSTATGAILYMDSPVFHFRDPSNSGATTLYIKTGGDVGIGTDQPAAKLDVNGDAGIRGANRLKFASDLAHPAYIKGRWADNNNTGLDIHAFVYSVDTTVVSIAEDGNVGIGITSPAAKLHVTGTTFLNGGQRVKVAAATDGMTLGESDYLVVANSSSALSINLPAAASGNSGRVHVIKNKSYGVVKIAGTIDGNNQGVVLKKNKSVTIVSDGSDWLIV